MEKILSRNLWSGETECDNCHGKTTWNSAIITLDTRHHEPAYCELFGDFEHFCPKCAVILGIHEKRRANFTIDIVSKEGKSHAKKKKIFKR